MPQVCIGSCDLCSPLTLPLLVTTVPGFSMATEAACWALPPCTQPALPRGGQFAAPVSSDFGGHCLDHCSDLVIPRLPALTHLLPELFLMNSC